MLRGGKLMSETNKTTAERRKLSPSLIVAIVAIVLVLVLAVVLVLVLTRKEPEPEVQGKATIVTEENVQDIMQSVSEPNTDASYTVTMTNEWTFEDGKASAQDFYVKNTENNSRTVYFDLLLADTNELIYSSPYIPVGESMDTITLDKELEAGDYNVIMTYHLVDDDKTEITTVSVTVGIHILN